MKKPWTYARTPLESGAELKSGDLVEVELELLAKNDFEYLIIEDPKAAGLEALDRESGNNHFPLRAWRELRDDRSIFFIRELSSDVSLLRYRLRAEVPGRFSALPARAAAVYSPELRANSAEFKLSIKD